MYYLIGDVARYLSRLRVGIKIPGIYFYINVNKIKTI